jgi:signal peptidase I
MSRDAAHHPHATVIETMQSLIVAFVLAMTFRGFVTEGFVIPTGAMAPTLLGEHVLLHSKWTGDDYAVGVDAEGRNKSFEMVSDPMLGPRFGSGANTATGRVGKRMGDRILVLKILAPFRSPSRYDVVVFKNPTDPDGKAANYIKRLIGLPNECIWLADGDVFAAPSVDGPFEVQRKPAHVQRAVWQRIHDSDLAPVDPTTTTNAPYHGPPWQGPDWDTSGRAYRCTTTTPTALRWNPQIRELVDWTSYNALTRLDSLQFPVSDLRVSAGVEAADPASLEMTLELHARDHVFELGIVRGTARARMRPKADPEGWVGADSPVELPDAGDAFNLDLWHVDQALHVFVDGERVAHFEYEWPAAERMEHAVGTLDWRSPREVAESTTRPALALNFSGSALTLHRVRTDRDLFYRPAKVELDPTSPRVNPTVANADFDPLVASNTPGFGTHPRKLAVLGPNHFMMLGDNSQASLDSRLWGNPHPLVAEQVDPTPFVVNRKLIIGKAWVVYFPAPFPVTENGLPLVPDFGRLRFIR